MQMIINIVETLLRAIFAFLDFLVYGVISLIYNLFIQISDTGIFSNEVFQRFSSRIYSIIGIVMLFKLAFSLISYIVNPDDFTSKEKGMGKLITNIMVVLVLIVVTPTIFREAFNLQRIIIKENVIGQLILGDTLRSQSSSGQVEEGWYEKAGKDMAFTISTAFVVPTVPECRNIVWSNPTAAEGCKTALGIEEDSTSPLGIKSSLNGGAALYKAFTDNDGPGLFNLGIINAKNNGVWLVDYTMLLSTIAGGFTAWIFFIFCFDIAVRTVKLGFLQIIAPVPIISYLDPKSGKSGIFSKWLKQCLSTFGDLFIRIVAIYFAIFVISQLTQNPMYKISSCDANMTNCTEQTNILVKVFIILGVLMFASKLPKLLEDMFGVKLGNLTLNPMKKLGESPFAAGAVGAVIGGVGGMAANAAALGQKIDKGRKDGKSTIDTLTGGAQGRTAIRNAMRSTVGTFAGGALGGMKNGLIGGAGSGGKGSVWKIGVDAVTKSSNARNLRGTGYGISDRIRDKATDMAGIKTDVGTSSQLGSRVKRISQQVEDSKMLERNIEQQKAALLQQARPGALKSEYNRIRSFQYEVDSEGKQFRKYNYDLDKLFTTQTIDGIEQQVLDMSKASDLFDKYQREADAMGLSGDQRLKLEEFVDVMSLEKQGWDQDLATKKLEKELKAAQEDESLAKPKKS